MGNETKLLQLFSNKEPMDDEMLHVSGELFISGCSLFGTEVLLFENNLLASKFICCVNGYFYFHLGYNKQYSIQIQKEGYDTRTISLNTRIGDAQLKKRLFEFGIALHRREDDPYQITKPTIAVRFSSEFDRFEIEGHSTGRNTLAS